MFLIRFQLYQYNDDGECDTITLRPSHGKRVYLKILTFSGFYIWGIFRRSSFYLSYSHSSMSFRFQDSMGYLQHFFQFGAIVLWQKDVSYRYTLKHAVLEINILR